MYTNGQTINYENYRRVLKNTPAPILGYQLPEAQIDLSGLIAYAHEKGVKVGDLSEEEKNQFISNSTVQSLQAELAATVEYGSLSEWNNAHSESIA